MMEIFHYFTSRSGNKGNKRAFVITLDAVISALIFVTILIGTSIYISESTEQRLIQLQLIRTANDIVTVLDYNGTLKTALLTQSPDLLDNETFKLLPNNIGLAIDVINSNPPKNVTLTQNIPKRGNLFSGERVLYINGNFTKVKYWVFQSAQSCIDTDSNNIYPSKNQLTAGTITVGGSSNQDFCLDASNLNEYYCENTKSAIIKSTIISCACTSGHC